MHPHPPSPGSSAPWIGHVASDVFTATVAELRRLTGALRRAKNRRMWRCAMQGRLSMVSAALATAERALGPRFAGRQRRGNVWNLHANTPDGEVLAVTLLMPPVHKLEEFATAVPVLSVLRTDLVALNLLRAFTARHSTQGKRS